MPESDRKIKTDGAYVIKGDSTRPPRGILDTPGATETTAEGPLTLEQFLKAVEAVTRSETYTGPITGGLRTTCFCTGECRSNPCHPCNGGIAGRPMQQGWLCPKCGNSNPPWAVRCFSCPPPKQDTAPTWPPVWPSGDCGCPYHTCMNVACPRRITITCSTDPNGSIGRWEGEGGAVPPE